jgi:hypothetical protein
MNAQHSPIVEFYRGGGVDHRGRTLAHILTFDDRELESTHDYIQWLFPLSEPSAFNAQAPLLSGADITFISAAAELQSKVVESFERMLAFYGFELTKDQGGLKVRKAARFEQRAMNWRTFGNHNYLRITRILKSLRLLGLPRHADAFLEALEAVYGEAPALMGDRTISFWRSAGQRG